MAIAGDPFRKASSCRKRSLAWPLLSVVKASRCLAQSVRRQWQILNARGTAMIPMAWGMHRPRYALRSARGQAKPTEIPESSKQTNAQKTKRHRDGRPRAAAPRVRRPNRRHRFGALSARPCSSLGLPGLLASGTVVVTGSNSAMDWNSAKATISLRTYRCPGITVMARNVLAIDRRVVFLGPITDHWNCPN